MIPFTILVYGINGRTVLQRLEAPRTLLVLEIVGKPHSKSPSVLFRHCCQQYIACAAAGACGVVGKRSLSKRLWSTRRVVHQAVKSISLKIVSYDTFKSRPYWRRAALR